MGLLKTESWKPGTKMAVVLLSLVSLLSEPNPADPLLPAIAEVYMTDRAKFNKTAAEWVKNFAK